MKITVLLEDDTNNSDLEPIHGVSFFIETDDNYKILFDTGQKDLFLRNAETLSLEPLKSNVCIISHNHYDHAGGLQELLERGYLSPVYLHNTFFRRKFSIKNGNKVLSIGAEKDSLLKYNNISMISETVTEIENNIFIFANIPFTNSFESIDENFLIEKEGTLLHDEFDDELVLAIKTQKGIVVISGCSHRGIINILDFIESYFKGERIFAFVGGTHLLDASDYRLEKTKISLTSIDPSVLAACHCTGKRGISFLSEHFPRSFVRIKTGSILNF